MLNDQLTIDTGDYVKHIPSGESWTVAYVRGDRLAWCGFPLGEARLSDCELISKCPAEQRLVLLKQLAALNDSRGSYARLALETTGGSDA
jgi:hypothetical protein